MRRPNHVWDAACQCFRYPSGGISVTDQEMYASVESMRTWAATGLCAALAWMRYGTTRFFTLEGCTW